jgi:hypothetical protein
VRLSVPTMSTPDQLEADRHPGHEVPPAAVRLDEGNGREHVDDGRRRRQGVRQRRGGEVLDDLNERASGRRQRHDRVDDDEHAPMPSSGSGRRRRCVAQS